MFSRRNSKPTRRSEISGANRTKPSSKPARTEASLTPVWCIRRSMRIHGELQGDVDVSIDGDFDGKITLENRRLFIGASSRVNADLVAKAIVLRGEVVGKVVAKERVTVTRTASVRGEIHAPRVTLAEGCRVSGRIVKLPLG